MNEANKKIIRYFTLPQVMPRLRSFMSSGLGYIAFYMALVYRAAGLIPAGHPYLNTANIDRFGVRHVIGEAHRRLRWDRQHIDQIIIFWLILTGLVIMCAQFALLALTMVTTAAHAGLPDVGNWADFFVTDAPEHDVAFVLLDRVFGVPDFFGSCVDIGSACYNSTNADMPYPFHDALRAVFQFYSIGLLVIAALIFLYFVAAIAVETAQTGTPFGKRFNHVWAPLRMVAALGLLIPLGSGLNAGQYITLYAAKWGSGFATNGWLLFIADAVAGEETLLGNRERLVATPRPPALNELLPFMSAVRACAMGEETKGQNVEAYLMNPLNDGGGAPMQLTGAGFDAALDYYGGATFESTRFLIYFGEFDGDVQPGGEQHFASRIQNTEPTCGSIAFEVTDVDEDGSPGSRYIMEQYYNMIQELWDGAGPGGDIAANVGNIMAIRHIPELDPGIGVGPAPPTLAQMRGAMVAMNAYIDAAIAQAVTMQQGSDVWIEDLNALGWGGAAIWYNKVAQMNGALISSAYNLPTVINYPMILEEAYSARYRTAQFVRGQDRFQIYQPNEETFRLTDPKDLPIARAMYASLKHWDGAGAEPSGNALVDLIQSIFGLDGLFNMRTNEGAMIHPLAQLVAIGKGIVNRAIISLGDAFVGFGVASVAKAFDMQAIGSVATAFGSIHGSIAMLGLGTGFTLFYVIPFLPFIYFFFAVGTWVKSIFEAMVGVPLWALAHIRIDGNGLPGDAAMGGYYMLLEIFLRPILIIFGLLASIVIFSAQVRVLHEIWELVVSNVAGFDKTDGMAAPAGLTGAIEWMRGPIDQFFYTIIYAIVVYMLGLSSFKLIDQIPEKILQWMGSSAQTFADGGGEETGNVMRSSMMGSNYIASQLKGAAGAGGQAVDSGVQAGKNLFR